MEPCRSAVVAFVLTSTAWSLGGLHSLDMLKSVIGGLFVLLLLEAVPTWSSWRARTKLRARIRAEWGHLCEWT